MTQKQSAESGEGAQAASATSPTREAEHNEDEATTGTGSTSEGESATPTATPPEEDTAGGGAADEDMPALRKRAEEAEARAQEHWERILRMEAEKDNIRKRAEKDAANARRQALEKFATEILAVRDSLELGHDAANQEDADLEKIREGTELTLKMLTQALQKFNIEEINPVGERFDPERHQAMSMHEAGEGQPANTVTTVVQKGYRLDDRLLRPALVIVAK